MVTTTDNKFNPFTQYDQWKEYDSKICGYDTECYIARVAALSTEFTPYEMDRACEDACDEICKMDLRYISPVTGEEVGYVKVVES
jgi:hypothetical protein